MTAESRRAEILRRKDTLADLLEEVRDYVGLSHEERDRLIQQTSRLNAQLARDRAGAPAPVDTQEPLPPSTLLIWKRLMEQYRRGRTPR